MYIYIYIYIYICITEQSRRYDSRAARRRWRAGGPSSCRSTGRPPNVMFIIDVIPVSICIIVIISILSLSLSIYLSIYLSLSIYTYVYMYTNFTLYYTILYYTVTWYDMMRAMNLIIVTLTLNHPSIHQSIHPSIRTTACVRSRRRKSDSEHRRPRRLHSSNYINIYYLTLHHIKLA